MASAVNSQPNLIDPDNTVDLETVAAFIGWFDPLGRGTMFQAIWQHADKPAGISPIKTLFGELGECAPELCRLSAIGYNIYFKVNSFAGTKGDRGQYQIAAKDVTRINAIQADRKSVV